MDAQNPLQELLKRNSIPIDEFYAETYNCLLISIFEVLVEEMSDPNVRTQIRDRIRNSTNRVLTVKKLVSEKTKCIINDVEASLLLDCFLQAPFA